MTSHQLSCVSDIWSESPGCLLPHGAERDAKILDRPDVLRVVTGIHLMRAHGLVELPKQVGNDGRVEGGLDDLRVLVRIHEHIEKSTRRTFLRYGDYAVTT